PIIDQYESKIFCVMTKTSQPLTRDGIHSIRREVRGVLNYLDAIAYGVEVGTYNGSIVETYLGSVMRNYTSDFIHEYELGSPAHFAALIRFTEQSRSD
ncbi:MAG: hypothetical protein AAFX52_08730, partial [Pseudomonadota bacterium]